MTKLRALFKILPALAMLLAVGVSASAAEAEALPTQAASAQAASVQVPGLSAPQSSTTFPPDSSPFVPDGPEKTKRVKKLLNQIAATYGFSRGREELFPSWGPRLGKLYALHKKLTDDDWQLLAEMYVSFQVSDLKIICGIPYSSKNISKLNSAMMLLLAMNGDVSIEILNAMMGAIHRPPALQRGDMKMIKMFIEDKPWSDTFEYKKDQ